MSYFWIENKTESDLWLSNTSANIFVSHEYFFNNSNIILSQDADFSSNFKSYISDNINIKPIIRKNILELIKELI